MSELLKRLSAYPLVTLELLGATFFANLLALASPLFVIQVLNRYVAHGVDSTLITLVAGVLIAIAFEAAFRQVRLSLVDSVSSVFDRSLAGQTYETLIRARAGSLSQIPPGQKREAVAAPDAIQQAYSAPNMAAYLDLPFAGVFLAALFMLNPVLAAIALGFAILAFAMGLLSFRAMRKPTEAMQKLMNERQGLLDSALVDPDMVRAFTALDHLRQRWAVLQDGMGKIRGRLARRQGGQQNFTAAVQAIMSTAMISVGGILVVGGNLDVGLLIGANILAARTLAPILRFNQSVAALARAKAAAQTIDKFVQLPLEPHEGSALGNYKGAIEFKDLGFVYPGQPTPLYESLNLKLEPGALMVVAGANGAGKTTLARLMAGLLLPARGQILVDGVDLSQVAPEWWRRQIIYVPQEPTFFNGTVRENLTAFNPDLDEQGLNKVIRDAGLESFFATHAKGFDLPLLAGGRELPLGIRRRLGLARALTTQGKLVIMDEPTEGLDAEGNQQIGKVMNGLKKQGCTIIALSHDVNIIKGAPYVLDLNSKPVPKLIQPSASPKPPSVPRLPEQDGRR